MHARHGSGAEMNILAAYGAAVGSAATKAVRAKAGSYNDLATTVYA